MTDVKRFGAHRNAFGALRLLFASLVIVSHTPALVDGDRSREPMTMIWGTISAGELAVDGFFLISGYLIAGSYLKRPVALDYLKRRILRIYPGYVVACAVSILVVAPLAGARPWHRSADLVRYLLGVATLQPPKAPGAFAGTPYPSLNGPAWTISYEFRCYLLVLLLGWTRVLTRRVPLAILCGSLLMCFALLPDALWSRIDALIPYPAYVLPSAARMCRLGGVFLAGSLFYLHRGTIRYGWRGVAAASVALALCLFVRPLAEPAVAVFGGYVVFALAEWGGSNLLGRINDRMDISYGTYLYAWPIEKLLLWYRPGTPLLLAGLVTLALALLCGAASWYLVEKPVMKRLR